MAINVTQFHLVNVTDTCAVWNVLSSLTLYRSAKQANVSFCITPFVHYECLLKKRSSTKPAETELQGRLKSCLSKGDFKVCEIQLQDLLIPPLLSHAGRIGKGEISAIAFAYRTRQAVLTDDQKARRIATDAGVTIVQTTPHLLGWLIYSRFLFDHDYKTIVTEHISMEGTLKPHLENAYHMGLRALCPIAATDDLNPRSRQSRPSDVG